MSCVVLEPPQTPNHLLSSEKDRKLFLQEATDLFLHKRQGHLIHRCYLTPAALFYGGKFTSTPKNYMRPGEISAIWNGRSPIGKKAKHSKGIIGIENGPGMGKSMRDKSGPFFSGLPGLHTWVGRDLSPASHSIMKTVMEEELPNVRIIPDMSDFLRAALPPDLGTGRKVFAEFGMTQGNVEGFPEDGFPYHVIKADIAAQRKFMSSGDIYVFTFDCNQNGTEVEAAYNSAWTTLWGRELLRSMKSDLPIDGDFDPDSYNFQSIWNAASHGSFNYMLASRRMEFTINNIDICVEKDEGWGITNSYKMPSELIPVLAENLDCGVELYRSKDKRIALPALIAN